MITKHIILSVAAAVLVTTFSGCDLLMPPLLPTTVEMPAGVSTPEQAWAWVAYNITFAAPDNPYRIQAAQETLDKRTGDCKAYSVLLATMIHQLGGSAWIVYGTHPGANHALVYCPQISDRLIEPQGYGVFPTDFHETSRMSIETWIMLLQEGYTSH
jgi:hypothetical protein